MNDLASIQKYKKFLLGVWIFAALSFVPPFSAMGIAQLGQSLFFMMFAVHVIECIVFFSTLKSTGKPLMTEFGQTLVFGVLHYREIKLAEEGSG